MALSNAFGSLALDTTTQAVLAAVLGSAEYIAAASTVTALGDTTVYAPAVGKSIRLHWVHALNDPLGTTQPRITVKLGTSVKYITYGVSKRQVDTGPVNGQLVVNLSVAGNVACTFRLEEV